MIGNYSTSCGVRGISIGQVANICNDSCDSISIGNFTFSQASCGCQVTIGRLSYNCSKRGIMIGADNPASASAFSDLIAIGNCIQTGHGCNINIGSNICNAGTDDTVNRINIAIGNGACALRTGGFQTIIGNGAKAWTYGVVIGAESCVCLTQIFEFNTIVGTQSKAYCLDTVIGDQSCSTVGASTILGGNARACSQCSNAIGFASCVPAGLTGASVIGASLTAERADTFHAKHILALGQGASKIHDIGSTGGTGAQVDWNNGNNQTVTLSADTTFDQFLNPIAGANYSLIITQTSGHNITWPGDILWPSGIAPVLSGGGETDVVALIYNGSEYFGTAAYTFQ
jgi:hypothetical protein